MDLYYTFVYILAYVGLFATTFYILSVFLYYRKKKEEKEDKKVRSVSIIIPAYNEEKSIERTIESALEIDYPADKLEIIIVDDGSKDKTYSLAKKFAFAGDKSHPRIIVLTKENGGKGSALNLGIKKSRGEVIISMDADTFVERDVLKKMMPYFSDGQVMAVTPAMGVYSPKNLWERIQQIEYYMGVFLRKAFAVLNAIHVTPGAFSAYRKSFFDKYGGYDVGNITEDLEVALRIQSLHFKIENAPNAGVYTLAPRTFRELLVQRRRWYVGLVQNLIRYKRLFSFKYGALGTVVLPVAVVTIAFSVVLTLYSTIKSLYNVRSDLADLQAVNFQFNNVLEFNSYVFERFFYNIFSQPVFLIAFLFLILISFYLIFSRKQLAYKEGVKINFILFSIFYSFLFAFWWIISFFYALFNKRVVWREEKDES